VQTQHLGYSVAQDNYVQTQQGLQLRGFANPHAVSYDPASRKAFLANRSHDIGGVTVRTNAYHSRDMLDWQENTTGRTSSHASLSLVTVRMMKQASLQLITQRFLSPQPSGIGQLSTYSLNIAKQNMAVIKMNSNYVKLSSSLVILKSPLSMPPLAARRSISVTSTAIMPLRIMKARIISGRCLTNLWPKSVFTAMALN